MASSGRQSPPPESQTDDQLNAPPAENPNQHPEKSAGPQKDKNTQTLKDLESNPTHILEKSAEEKTSKH